MSRTFALVGAALVVLVGVSLLALQQRLTALEEHNARLQQEARAPRGAGKAQPARRKPPEGKVGLVVSNRRIPAYTLVNHEHLVDPETATVLHVYLAPKQVFDNFMPHLHQVLGRVLRREKLPGQIFVREDFYPHGTRPGPMAGVPTGKRGVWVETSDVPGLAELKQHDRFDLLMTLEVGAGGKPVAVGEADPEPNQPKSPSAPAASRPHKRVEVRTIARRADVVQPAGEGRTAVFIAVDPAEVAALDLARSLDARLSIAVRSGKPVEKGTDQGAVPDVGWIRVYEPAPMPAPVRDTGGDE